MGRIAVVTVVVLVVAEIAVFDLVGHLIGGLATFGLVVVSMLIGIALVKHEGARSWRTLRAAVARGRSPDTAIVDGALVLFGGALMVAPGFITDVLGLALLVPPVRRLVRAPLIGLLMRRVGLAGRTRRVRSRRGSARPYVDQPTSAGADARMPSGAPRVIDGAVRND